VRARAQAAEKVAQSNELRAEAHEKSARDAKHRAVALENELKAGTGQTTLKTSFPAFQFQTLVYSNDARHVISHVIPHVAPHATLCSTLQRQNPRFTFSFIGTLKRGKALLTRPEVKEREGIIDQLQQQVEEQRDVGLALEAGPSS
jgi:hypothetical protein